LTIQEYLADRIKYAEGRIEFWKSRPEIQQVWKGIKKELEDALEYEQDVSRRNFK